MKTLKASVCILGAGAGGTGATYRLIKNGVDTVVVDKNPDFGGSAVFAGVDGWEPGPSLDGMHTLLYEKMAAVENGCHVVIQMPNCNIFDKENGTNWDNHSFAERPWGLSSATDLGYEATLKNATFGHRTRLQFEPSVMAAATNAILDEYREHLTTLFGYRYLSCKTECDRIKSITVTNGSEECEISADYFIDASGDILLARDAGCGYSIGCDGTEAYGEPSAGEKSSRVNAVSYVFRISPTEDKEHVDEIPSEYASVNLGDYTEGRMKKTVSCLVEYPNGDYNINMLPTMQGAEYLELGDRADLIGRARVWAYWHYWQTEKGMKGYTLTHIFDAGIRESYRLKGKYILTENDLRAGKPTRPTRGITVAVADHSMDIHGDSGMCNVLDKPYEVPLECAETCEYGNLFVACRGASFSHIAASSVRLTRTMISMGEGVGEYIADKLSKE